MGRPRGVSEQRTVEARARNCDLLAAAYREHRPFTVRFLARQVDDRDRSAVEDLTQETFIRAWPYLDKVEDTAERPLRPWLAQIARQTLHNQYRRDPGKQHAAERPAAPNSPVWHWKQPAAGDTTARVDPRVDQLTAALATLPPAIRQAVELRVANGMLVTDVAEEQQVSREAVRCRVTRGLTALRATMADHPATKAPGRETADPMQRARRAVAQAQQRAAAGEARQAAGATRVEQMARWHADDQAAYRQQEHTAGAE